MTTADVSQIYLVNSQTPNDVNGDVLSQTGSANLHKGRKLIIGCTTQGDTGNVTIAQPITFTFKKVSQKVKQGTPTTFLKSALPTR